MKIVALYGLYLAFLAFIFGGTAYLVAVHGWSGWWFLLAIFIVPDFQAGLRAVEGDAP